MNAPHFLKEFKVMLCCLDCFKDSILDKNTLAPFHWAIHLTIEWIFKEFFHHHFHFLCCKKTYKWGSKSLPLEEEGTHSPLSSWCFVFIYRSSLKHWWHGSFCSCYLYVLMFMILIFIASISLIINYSFCFSFSNSFLYSCPAQQTQLSLKAPLICSPRWRKRRNRLVTPLGKVMKFLPHLGLFFSNFSLFNLQVH